ncbi:hypothetical protein ACQR14_33930 [Bradyrhizobium oligotrophicum]|uniref:hypothetical protein n=1 Tax=Bradyrhizobium oligotrophicum TaxID=44255 RepID=UPI003EBC047B
MPPFQLTDGRIPVCITGERNDSPGSASQWLDVANKLAFGTVGINVDQGGLVADLVPDGLEFDAEIRNPLAPFMRKSGASADELKKLERVQVRLRLVYAGYKVGTGLDDFAGGPYALDLVGPSARDATALPRLCAALSSMAEMLRREDDGRSPLIMRPDTTDGIPRLRWWLKDNMRLAGPANVYGADLAASTARPSIISDQVEGGTLQSTAAVAARRVRFERKALDRDMEMRLIVAADEPNISVDEALRIAREPVIDMTWNRPGGGGTPGFTVAMRGAAGADIPLGIERAALQDRLGTLYRTAKALPTDVDQAPFVFILVQRGLLQLPLPPADADIGTGNDTQSSQIGRGALIGSIVARVAGANAVPRWAEIDSAASVAVTASWKYMQATGLGPVETVAIQAKAPRGGLRGFVWAADSSPTPTEIVPTLRGGPAAVRDVELRFGEDADAGFGVSLGAFRTDAPDTPVTVKFQGPIPKQTPVGWPAIVATAWLGHETLPLAASTDMTRTAASSTEPSLSRELVAHRLRNEEAGGELRWSATAKLWLRQSRLSFDPGSALDDSGWPWPQSGAGKPGWSETPSVTMVMPTLPGTEFAAASLRALNLADMRMALRFDLPILDGYFAAVAPRRSTEADSDSTDKTAPQPPTSLDPAALTAAWMAAADRLALTRTQLAYATPWISASATPVNVAITGLYEPYTWSPAFGFDPRVEIATFFAPIGMYSLWQGAVGEKAWGKSALRGVSGVFKISGEALQWSGLIEKPKPDSGEVNATGFAIAARSADGKSIDTRNFGLAFAPWDMPKPLVSGGRLALRAATVNKADWQFATPTEAFAVSLLGAHGKFWFSNLPLKGLKFAGADNPLESASGPAANLFDGDTLPLSNYEWRFFCDEGGARAFDVPLGPYRFRPLRLWAVEFENPADDKVALKRVVIVGRLAMWSPTTTDGPYGFDGNDELGNIVELGLEAGAGGMAAKTLRRISVTRDKLGKMSFVPAPAAPLEFELRPPVHWGVFGSGAIDPNNPQDVRARLSTVLQLTLEQAAGIDANGIVFSDASLRATLFGSAIKLSGGAISADGHTLTWTAPKVPLVKAGITLWQVVVSWLANQAPEIRTTACATVAVRGHEGSAIRAVDWSIGDAVRWFGLALPVEELKIDHGRGALLASIAKTTPSGTFIDGLALGDTVTAGSVALVAQLRPEEAWPSWTFSAGHARFRAEDRHLGFTLCQRLDPVGNAPFDIWRSRLTVDLAVRQAPSPSGIKWPTSITASRSDGTAVPMASGGMIANLNGKNVSLAVANDMTLTHEVALRLRGHLLPAELLAENATSKTFALAGPWRVFALALHTLSAADGRRLEWKSLDHVAIFDLRRTMMDARASNGGKPEYAFAARYLGIPPAAGVKHPGIVERALANAGFPMKMIAQAFHDETLPVQPVLFAVGAGVTRSRIGKMEGGVVLAMPWVYGIVGAALPDLLSFDQSGSGPWEVSDVDYAAGLPAGLGGRTQAHTLENESEASIHAMLAAGFAQSGPDATWHWKALVPVDQSFAKALPGTALSKTPLWIHAMIAVRELWQSAAPLFAASRVQLLRPDVVNLIPSGDTDGRAVALALADPPDAAPSALPQAIRMLAVGRSASIRPKLRDFSSQSADWSQLPGRARDGLLDPLMVVAQLSASPEAQTAAARARTATADEFEGADEFDLDWPYGDIISAADDFGVAAVTSLRRLDDVVYPSGALGWPSAARIAELSRLAPGIGDEAIVRNEKAGVSGRVRSHAWPPRALGGEASAPDAIFLTMNERPVFERPKLSQLVSQAALHLLPAPPRRRVPLKSDLDDVLKTRAPVYPGQVTPVHDALPIIPPGVEHLTVGQRPGTLYATRDDATIALTDDAGAFDPQFSRFGRPAAAGPAVLRQGRTPRSSAFPRTNKLPERRRTFVAQDETFGTPPSDELSPFRWMAGTAALLRDESQISERSLLFRMSTPTGGIIDANWNGRITIDVTSASADDYAGLLALVTALAARPSLDGLMPILSIGPAVYRLTLTLPTQTDPPLKFVADLASADADSVRSALRTATADTRIALAITFAAPPGAGELESWRPTVSLPMALAPHDRPAFPVALATLLFADPAYDRELAGPALQKHSNEGSTPWLIAIDRFQYDRATRVNFAFGEIDPKSGLFIPPNSVTRSVAFKIKPAAARSDLSPPPRLIAIRGRPGVGSPKTISYTAMTAQHYSVSLEQFVETRSDGTNIVADETTMVVFNPGDQLEIFVLDSELTVSALVVAEPVLVPPPAVYALVVIDGYETQTRRYAHGGVPLFASGPLPQVLEYPDMVGDLARGLVKRRAIFQWNYGLEGTPAQGDGAPRATLVKIDRSGGGQVPESAIDFFFMT